MKKFIWSSLILCLLLTSTCLAKINVPDEISVKLNNGEIITLDLDEYLYSVVLSEMGVRYKVGGQVKDVELEALKAQAVASRTYAVSKILSNSTEDFDVTSSTSNQVYKESNNVNPKVKQAVDETSKQILTYDGKIISAYFFSTSGGHTEAPENVWSSSLPYLKGVEDPYEPFIDGRSTWEARIPKSKYGKIEILEVGSNDRVTKLKVGNEVLSKNAIRTKLGTSLIRSTWFDLEYDSKTSEYVFTGRGFGHGVGMSQYGAMGMAEAGFDYEEILKWYYTDVELENSKKTSTKDTSKNNVKENNKDAVQSIDKNYGKTDNPYASKPKEYGVMLTNMLSVVNRIYFWR